MGRAVIAWGGPFAQLVLLVGAMAWVAAFGFPRDATAWAVVSALLGSNLWLLLVNLIPIAPLDGAEAWWLPVLLGRSLRRRPPRSQFEDGEAEFEAGARSAEVKALVKGLLDDARKDVEP
jgi:Zn-dependent protease